MRTISRLFLSCLFCFALPLANGYGSEKVISDRIEFNELCEDGVFRPAWIIPAFVTGIQQIKTFSNNRPKTLITWKGPDTFKGVGQEHDVRVYEPFNI